MEKQFEIPLPEKGPLTKTSSPETPECPVAKQDEQHPHISPFDFPPPGDGFFLQLF